MTPCMIAALPAMTRTVEQLRNDRALFVLLKDQPGPIGRIASLNVPLIDSALASAEPAFGWEA